MTSAPIISVDNLSVTYRTNSAVVPAVRGVSLELRPGETLGIVGESGSGKSTVGLALMQLLPRTAEVGGSAVINGIRSSCWDASSPSDIRGSTIGLVYQDALAALNPYRRVGSQIAEVTRHHLGYDRRHARREAIDALARVGISDAARRAQQYPHEFSGGMRQRAAIAMALAAKPKVLLADEPTTALDVTVQTQIVSLLGEIRKVEGMAMIVISHDLHVIRRTADRIAVMYHGCIVETGKTEEVLLAPTHPYTRDLIRSAPTVEEPVIAFIPGNPPRPGTHLPGCSFEPRCSVGNGNAACRDVQPGLRSLPNRPGSAAACHFPLSGTIRDSQPQLQSKTA